MDRPSTNLQRWWIPLASGFIFFLTLGFLLPYATGYGGVKKSLGMLVLSLSQVLNPGTGGSALDYTYCAFVPFIFGYLVYLRRAEIRRVPVRRQGVVAGVLLALGVFLYWFGLRAEMQYFGYAALQILLAAVILFFWGTKVFRLLLFPWAFFCFAWPLPFLDPIIAFPLRMEMSRLAGIILPVCGVPCVQNGTALLSAPEAALGLPLGGRFQIDIADPCSGIRSLFALLMFSALFADLLVPRGWRQWVVFLSAFPLAVLGNLARVLLLVAGSLWFGNTFAIGTMEQPSAFHEACGFAVYAVALGLEILLASLLERKWRRVDKNSISREREKSMPPPTSETMVPPALVESQATWPDETRSVPSWRPVLLLALTAAVALSYHFNPPVTLTPQAGVTLDLPDQVGRFHGFDADFTPAERIILPNDTGLARKNYDDLAGHIVRCTIVLSGSEQRSIHRPEACMVGQGWNVVAQEDLPVALDSGHPLVVRNLTLQRMVTDSTGARREIRCFYMYWFVGENITTPSHFTRIFLSSWDRFRHNRAHRWAYVSVDSLITEGLMPNGLNAAATREMMTGFIRQSVSSFQKSEMP